LVVPFPFVARFIKATPRTLNWISTSDVLWPETFRLALGCSRLVVVDASGITTSEINSTGTRLTTGLVRELREAASAVARVLVLYDANILSKEAIIQFLSTQVPHLRARVVPYGQRLETDFATIMFNWP
jgi:hypothetical protein